MTKAKINHHKEKKHGPGTTPHRQCATIHNCGYCNYGSKFKYNVEMHELSCKVKKRHETRLEDIPITNHKLQSQKITNHKFLTLVGPHYELSCVGVLGTGGDHTQEDQ